MYHTNTCTHLKKTLLTVGLGIRFSELTRIDPTRPYQLLLLTCTCEECIGCMDFLSSPLLTHIHYCTLCSSLLHNFSLSSLLWCSLWQVLYHEYKSSITNMCAIGQQCDHHDGTMNMLPIQGRLPHPCQLELCLGQVMNWPSIQAWPSSNHP